MKQLSIMRVGKSDLGIFGVMRQGQVPFALTLELPWRENQENISSIPAGTYLCQRIVSPHFGDVFEVTNVPGRTHVLVHKANFLTDLKGCIGVGERFDGPVTAPFLSESKKGFDQYMALVADVDAFRLTIVDVSEGGTSDE